MGRKITDRTGQRYGRLTVLSLTDERKKSGNNAIWLCRCDCGNIVKVSSGELRSGARTKSCGCLKKSSEKKNKTHGDSGSKLYVVWQSMRRRCYDPNASDYENYGGRGIKVCEYFEDYSNFREWALENGYDPSAKKWTCTLDRIDTDGDYEPSNCRWVDAIAQQNNKRNNVRVTYNGTTKTVSEWERTIGAKKGFVRDRLERGWSVEEALTKQPMANSTTKIIPIEDTAE